jgi:hypothetical protein
MAALEFIENPRKAPRIMVRCHVRATAAGVAFEGSTEDFGPHGCQVVSPRPFPKGTSIALVLSAADSPVPLQATGTVAWVSPHEPWRLGIAFGEAFRPSASRFFESLLAARPGLAEWRKVPSRISLDAMVWLAPPPRRLVDFTPEEVELLRSIGTGATIYELKARLRDRWALGLRAFFSLLSAQYITLSRGGAVPFANWSALLHQLEAELAVSSLSSPGAAEPTPLASRPAATWPTTAAARPSFDGSSGLDLDPSALQLAEPAKASAFKTRRPEATEAFDQALAELDAGHHVSAVALLRRALALAPGDPEIARKLGEVASRID